MKRASRRASALCVPPPPPPPTREARRSQRRAVESRAQPSCTRAAAHARTARSTHNRHGRPSTSRERGEREEPIRTWCSDHLDWKRWQDVVCACFLSLARPLLHSPIASHTLLLTPTAAHSFLYSFHPSLSPSAHPSFSRHFLPSAPTFPASRPACAVPASRSPSR
eukprot:2876372-Pleurochrysis_carterae.AAC.4